MNDCEDDIDECEDQTEKCEDGVHMPEPFENEQDAYKFAQKQEKRGIMTAVRYDEATGKWMVYQYT